MAKFIRLNRGTDKDVDFEFINVDEIKMFYGSKSDQTVVKFKNSDEIRVYNISLSDFLKKLLQLNVEWVS